MTRRNCESITESLKEESTTESTESTEKEVSEFNQQYSSVLSVVKNEFRCDSGMLARSRRSGTGQRSVNREMKDAIYTPDIENLDDACPACPSAANSAFPRSRKSLQIIVFKIFY